MFSAICIHSMPTLRESLKSFMFPQINCTFWVRVFQMPFSNNFFSNKKNHTLQQPIALINKPSTGKKDVISEITTCRDGFRMANVWFAVAQNRQQEVFGASGRSFSGLSKHKSEQIPNKLIFTSSCFDFPIKCCINQFLFSLGGPGLCTLPPLAGKKKKQHSSKKCEIWIFAKNLVHSSSGPKSTDPQH